VITCHEAPDVGELIGAMPHGAHLGLGAIVTAGPTARTQAQAILGGWGLARSADVGMIISELVTNAAPQPSQIRR
jgi:hypothetical protein